MKHNVLFPLSVALMLGCQAPTNETQADHETHPTMSTANDQTAI